MDAPPLATKFACAAPADHGASTDKLGFLLGHNGIGLRYCEFAKQVVQEARMAITTRTKIVPICCVCGLIREESRSKTKFGESWVTKKTFRQTHGIDPSALRLSHTYCPTCYTGFLDRITAA